MLKTAFDGVDELVLLLEANSGGATGANVVVGLAASTGMLRHTSGTLAASVMMIGKSTSRRTFSMT